MRLFTAIDIPEAVRIHLRVLLDRLRPLAALKWSRVENLHVTTKFIGEWPEPRLSEMKQVLSGVSGTPIEIAVRNLGWFPNQKSPRVLWAGIEASPSLSSLANLTEAAVEKIGVRREPRTYSPHLTLARIPDRPPLEKLQHALADLSPRDFGSFRATEFFLYLSAGGAYTKLAAFPLA